MNTQRFKPKAARRFATCIGAAAVAVMTMGPVLAIDDIGLFELEGDALDSNGFPTLPDDWDTLYVNGGHATATTDPKNDDGIGGDNVIVEDPAPATIFTQGGSKDENQVSDPANPSSPHVWNHKSGSVPDKDDITQAYAANYVNPANNHQIIYFGADRYANDGDALMGFWFFQDDVGTNTDGTFSGVHINGDVFIIASFTGGGQDVTVEVLEWDDTCAKGVKNPGAGQCAGTNLRLKVPETSAKCVAGGAADNVCAIANAGDAASPWPYTPKQGSANTFPVASFFEGGIDIDAIFGGSKCFSSFLAETRSSSSVDAVLKDFVLGDFNVCSVAATKECVNDDTLDDTETAITYNIRGCALNDASGEIKVTSLLNSIGGGSNYVPADLEWFTPPGTFDPATDCDDPVKLEDVTDNDGSNDGTPVNDLSTALLAGGEALVYQFSETSAVSAPQDTVTIDAEGPGGAEIDAATDGATCPARAFSADLHVTKSCQADLEDAGANVVVRIDFSGQVCNDGEATLSNLVLSDVESPDNSPSASFTLDPDGLHPGTDTTLKKDECVAYEGSYYPSSIPTGDICPFSDTVTAVVDLPSNSTPVDNTCDSLAGTCEASSDQETCNLRAVNGDADCATGPLSP